ncbi:putative transcription factor Tesmin family [Lupinus albus]|uniref:Putative transcription factor Tesmin family n=1 Tax=Lupinus albus TaxID=3870 RepID=A0A6A4QG15_LUPAL|nr:putative transcription factor Tesmin family [Lupinus albus]
MDTPHSNQINSPLHPNFSPFQDSPVFNFINSLSPIKPVKPVPISHTFNSLTCSSPPSIFTSPHVSSLKDSRFLRRHIPVDTLKPTDSSLEVHKMYSNEEPLADSTPLHHNLTKFQDNTAQGISTGEAAIELPQSLKYNCGSPGYDATLCVDEANILLELPTEAASDVTFVQKQGCKTNSVESQVLCQGTCQIEPKSELQESIWDGLSPSPANLFIFNSPNEAGAFNSLFQKPLDSSVDFMSLLPQSTINNGRNVQLVHTIVSGFEHENEDHHSDPVAATETDHAVDDVAMSSNPNEKTDNELVPVMHRGLRRRCLDFEMASVRQKKSDDYSKTDSSTSQSGGRNVANEKHLIPTEQISVSRNCILPGIGLHLNALATLKDHNSITKGKFSSGRQGTLLCSTSSLQISTSQEHHHLSVVAVPSEREFDLSNNDVQPGDDCPQASAYMAREDPISNSPKKKRKVQHKSDPAGETEGCKRCNCKKSKCLKLYCECFAAGVYCIEPCSCQDCFNQAIHEDTVLQTRKQIVSRNPLAFAPKVIRSSESVPDVGGDPNKTPASARHKRGCNCKKSSCLKKYCECYQGGVGCSISCRCEGCKNAFGRKDGSAVVDAWSEEETGAREKNVAKKALQKTESQNIEDHSDSALVATPSLLSRTLLPLPFSSNGKPPRSFVTTISSSALFASSQKLGKPNSLWSQSKHAQTVPDDEIPDALCSDNSPVTCIKTSSPKGKRISSPKCDLGSSPSRKGGRKLILQSIPSFPSLANQQ